MKNSLKLKFLLQHLSATVNMPPEIQEGIEGFSYA